MNRQKFLAELSRLLGFMSSWDREAEMNKYIEMFDAAEDEAALIESVGTPTQIAISVALGYKSTPRPGTQPPEPEPAPEPEPPGESGDGAEPEPGPETPPPPKKKRAENEIVTDSEFDYGMELALLMGEPVSAAVESAFKGEYLPDPELSLDEILREARGGKATDGTLSESGEASAETGGPEAEAEASEPAAEAGGGPEEAAGPEAAPEGEEAQPEQAPPEPEAESVGSEPEDASAPEDEPAEASGTGDEEAPEAGYGPVFDAATAPLPEAVKSAEMEQSADAPEPEAKHPPHLVFDPEKFAPLPEDQAADDGEADEAEDPHAARRPAGIAAYVLFSLVIGIPVALLLILIGVPVLLLGLGAIAGTVYAAIHIIAALSMFSDILLVVGAGLAIGAVGLLIAWLGLWLSIELGSLWINAVMLKLGRALCFKRGADVE